MATKRDPKVDTYIATSPPFARPILQHLRKLIHQGNPDVEETIKWHCPFFTYQGQLFSSIAAFKAHATFNLHHVGIRKLLAKEVGKTDEAMGLLGRLTSLQDLPDAKVLLHYIETAKNLHDSGAPRTAKPKRRPAPPVPADLAAALKGSKKAAQHWKDFSPSAHREYIEWITEAKRDETRAQRLRTTIEWVAGGKPRNWKYQNC